MVVDFGGGRVLVGLVVALAATAAVSLGLPRKGAAYALSPTNLLPPPAAGRRPPIVASDEPPQLASRFGAVGSGDGG